MKTELQSYELIALFRMCTSLMERLEKSESHILWLEEQRKRELAVLAQYVPTADLKKLLET